MSTSSLFARYHRLTERQRKLRADAHALTAQKYAIVRELRKQMRVQEIAAELGVTRAHIYNMIWEDGR